MHGEAEKSHQAMKKHSFHGAYYSLWLPAEAIQNMAKTHQNSVE